MDGPFPGFSETVEEIKVTDLIVVDRVVDKSCGRTSWNDIT